MTDFAAGGESYHSPDDVLTCGRCAGRMRVLSVIEEPDVIDKILRHLGLPPVPLPTAPARGQRAFDFDAT